MAKYCAQCGAPFPPGQKFCSNCGAPLETETLETQEKTQAFWPIPRLMDTINEW